MSWAATKGHGNIIRLLLENKANPLKLNVHGQNAFDIAMAGGFIEVSIFSLCKEKLQKIFAFMQVADLLERATKLFQVAPKNQDSSLSMSMPSLEKLSYSTPSSFDQPGTLCKEMDMVLLGLNLNHLKPLFLKHKVYELK